MDIGWQLALIVVLIGVNAALAGTEMALVSLREGQLRRLEDEGPRGAVVGALARDPNRFLATIQVGITLAGFLASATAAVTLAEPLVRRLGALGGAARPVAVVAVTTVLTLLTLVLGELAPKRLALQRSERWALRAARPLNALATLARPMVWLLGRATDVTVRLAGGDPGAHRPGVTEEEIRDLVAAGGLYSREERRVITGALEATERVLQQVLRPRPQVLALADDTPAGEALEALVRAGHQRAPVYRADLDDADRVVSLIDLVGASGTVGDRARPAVALPESALLLDALRQLQAARQTMAIVLSEYGGVEGIVTVEDLVEELVGEIHDEYDRDVRRVVRNVDGSLTIRGDYPIHDLVDIDVDLPAGEYVTVGGLVNDRLGRLAVAGDEVQVDDWDLTVEAVRDRTVVRVRVRRRPASTGRDPGRRP